MFRVKKLTKLQKFLFILCLSIFATGLRVCAEEVSTAQAKVYREKFITEAKKYVGCPYVYGAVGPDSFDCSGLIYFTAHQANGLQLPRTAKALYGYARVVPDSQREPGDLVFFKTTSSGSVSHVGIYIGNNQFISAVSDGPNTGVILSSLNEAYWKPRYIGTGQIFKSGKMNEESGSNKKTASRTPASKGSSTSSSTVQSFSSTVSSFHNQNDSFLNSIVFDSSVECAWSLLKENSFVINFRGIDVQTNARISKWMLEPGIGLSFRYNAGLGNFQLPILASMTINDYVRFYAGPVFSFGNACLPGSDREIKPSVLPGIIGLSLSTPSFTKGDMKIQLVQNINYSINNKTDGSALSMADSIIAGLELFTGIRVSLSPHFFSGK